MTAVLLGLGVRLVGVISRATGWMVADGSDPFGSVPQDPDQVRHEACTLVAPRVDCTVASAPPRTAPPESGGGSGVGTVLQVLLYLALAALVVMAVLALLRWSPRRGTSGKRRRRTRGDAADEVEIEALVETAIDHRRAPRSWRDEADEHRRAGRFRDALRCRYRALVGDLARRGVIDEIPGRTTGEERTQLALVLPDAASPFAAAAGLFDDAWYGDAPVGDGDVDTMVQLEQEVLAMAAAPEPAGPG